MDLSNGPYSFREENVGIFKLKRAPSQVNTYFYRFTCAISPWNFTDLELSKQNGQKNLWTSVKTLAINLDYPAGKMRAISSLNELQNK